MTNKIVAGNWKMNNDKEQTKSLLNKLNSYKIPDNVRVIVAPSYTQLDQSIQMLKGTKISVAAQNMNAASSGAFTGEVSAAMLKSIGVNSVIIGHSERRSLYHESDDILNNKVKSAIESDMEIIFCFGEELDDRKTGQQFEIINKQLSSTLFNMSELDWKKIILAYEPVWAIGTGETASPSQAQEMHAYIRKIISNRYNDNLANNVSILYGGSVKPSNVKEIFKGSDVNGGLIGGASLNADDFMAIVNAF